jgi:light-regulated signal transduction histidine kinase (bacteriophytochrome)
MPVTAQAALTVSSSTGESLSRVRLSLGQHFPATDVPSSGRKITSNCIALVFGAKLARLLSWEP